MSKLIEEEVYKPVHIIDYQAVCFRERKTTNFAAILKTVCYFLWYRKGLLAWDTSHELYTTDRQRVYFYSNCQTHWLTSWNFNLHFLQPLENLRLVMAWLLTSAVWFYDSITCVVAQASGYSSLDDGK